MTMRHIVSVHFPSRRTVHNLSSTFSPVLRTVNKLPSTFSFILCALSTIFQHHFLLYSAHCQQIAINIFFCTLRTVNNMSAIFSVVLRTVNYFSPPIFPSHLRSFYNLAQTFITFRGLHEDVKVFTLL